MPLQSFAQRTVSLLPHGIRPPLLKLARPSSPTISQRQPRLKRVVVEAFCSAGGWPSPRGVRPSWFGSNLVTWPLLQRLLSVRAVRPASDRTRRSRRLRSGLLSWGSSKIAPPPVQMPCVHSRTSQGPPFGPKLPHFRHVPPLPFFPTTAAYSARHPAGLLHPASGHGVRHVSGPLPTLHPKAGSGARHPRWRSTLRSFPLRSSTSRVTALRGPLAVTASFRLWVRTCCHDWALDLSPLDRPQGFAPPRSPLSARRRCHRWTARCSLGLSPTHGSSMLASPPSPRGVAGGAPLAARGPRGDLPGDSDASSPRPKAKRIGVRRMA
jgi:hypothetical protein